MAVTTIGLFENRQQAEAAVARLQENGFDRSSILITENTSDIDRISRNLQGDASFYRSFLSNRGTLVAVEAPDDRIHLAAEILNDRSFGAIDADARSAEYHASGHTEARLRDYTDRDLVLPVVEEDIKVGKRQVERGRVRVYSNVEEVPVEEQVNLREEHVHVERRPVDRPASEADLTNLPTGSFEIRSTAEEAVVSKEARVVEEVVVSKDVQERTETIRDTVRRTDVNVEEVEGERAVGSRAYETYATSFRNYYDANLRSSGLTYEDYDPAFRYGYTLANDSTWGNRDWNTVEADVQRRWEERNPGTWDRFKAAVRHAWDEATGRR